MGGLEIFHGQKEDSLSNVHNSQLRPSRNCHATSDTFWAKRHWVSSGFLLPRCSTIPITRQNLDQSLHNFPECAMRDLEVNSTGVALPLPPDPLLPAGSACLPRSTDSRL
jgi:hypothetical protein